VVTVPLGHGIGETWTAVRERIEVDGHGSTWQITAGSFDSALTYARERFGEPVVLARRDRTRWWPRVTLTVSTDPTEAAAAPPLEDLARPVVPEQRAPEPVARRDDADLMPRALEEIFARQDHREA
jgi:hypothetical protein